MNEDKKLSVPKWLEDLQQKSWEPEILLSGIVLYGMFKVPDLLDDFQIFFKATIFGNSNDINNLVGLFKMGIYWLITGLILHLICRGIWIGMVGLSYSFPNGIQHERLEYKGRFKNKIARTPSYELIVMRLEKISSSLFSVSFMLFMSLLGGYLFFLVLLIIPFTISYLYFDISFDGLFIDVFKVYATVIFVTSIIGLIDFLSLGYFRRFKWIAKIYWPIHQFISALTLSRFYRPIYYGMVSNFNRWAFFFFLLVFTVVSIMGAVTIANRDFPGDAYSRLSLWNDTRGYNSFGGYYDDQNEDEFSTQAQIQSDIISSDVIKLFVPANVSYEDEMEELMSLDSLKEQYPDTARSALNHMLVKAFYLIKIDEDTVDAPMWYTHYKWKTRQYGYLTYISINKFDEGMHQLTVSGNHKKFTYPFAIVPFYKDASLSANRPKTAKSNSNDQEIDFQPKPFGIRK